MIRAIAIGLFRRGGEVLCALGSDSATGERFARPLGGAIEHGERSDEALEREIREELGLEVADLELLGVLESIFDLAGERYDEIVFVYDGRFADPSVYERESIPILEIGWEGPARWQRIDGAPPLVPEGLIGLLRAL